MNSLLRFTRAHSKALAGGAVVTVLALVIGCGGGGGSTSTTSVTNGTAQTGNTNGDTNGNTNAATNGNNGSTNNGSTSGNNGTTNGTTNGTSSGNGVLPTNVILFSTLNGSNNSMNLEAISPTGSSPTTILANIPPTMDPIVLNPAVKGQYIAAIQASAGSLFGIYSTTGATTTGDSLVAKAAYALVYTLAVSNSGGAIVFTASDAGDDTDSLYYVSSNGGTVSTLDAGEECAIGPDNDSIVYSKFVGLNTQIFIRSLSKGTVTTMTTDGTDHDYPQFSKDGTEIIFQKGFTKGTAGNQYEDFGTAIMNVKTRTEVDLPNPSQINETGPSLDGASDTVSFLVSDGIPVAVATQAASGAAGTNYKVLYANENINSGGSTYWTSSSGRGIGVVSYGMTRSHRRGSPARVIRPSVQVRRPAR